jgi:hypothetical protein
MITVINSAHKNEFAENIHFLILIHLCIYTDQSTVVDVFLYYYIYAYIQINRLLIKDRTPRDPSSGGPPVKGNSDLYNNIIIYSQLFHALFLTLITRYTQINRLLIKDRAPRDPSPGIKLLHKCFKFLCSSLMPYWLGLCVLRRTCR